MKSINPANNQLIKEYTEPTPQEVKDIISATHQEWLDWKKTSFSERAKLMHNASEILLKEKDECAAIITSEMGKLSREAVAEVEKCAMLCRYFADSAETILQDEVIETDYSKSVISFEPIGIVLAVMPWNFPFWQVWRFIVPAIMAGNAGVLKHASNVFGCAVKIEEIMQKAGFPKNLFRSLIISSRQVEAVIQNPLVKAVTLTGSEGAGSKVASTAGKELKKSVLELGGSDPFIVLKDANLELAAKMSVPARLGNAGQVCISAKRFIVEESVVEEFIALQKKEFESLTIGDPFDDKTQMAPMARPDLVNEIEVQVDQSIKMGAQLVTGGERLDSPGNFYTPTILAEVKKGMPVYDDETFGPVAAIITVSTPEEAIEIANDTPYGLGASVWTGDASLAEKIARQIDTGMVFINTVPVSNPKLPFGGTKLSGYGRECSTYGIKEFVNIKTICVA